jgi:hypothetical protein
METATFLSGLGRTVPGPESDPMLDFRGSSPRPLSYLREIL